MKRFSGNKAEEKVADEMYYVRPYSSDTKYIEKMIRASGKKKPEVMREIIKAGCYHIRMTEARIDPTHEYTKQKTVEAVEKGIIPTGNKIDNLLVEIAAVNVKLDNLQKYDQQLDRKLTATGASLAETLDVLKVGVTEIFRNILSIRGLIYIFILAFRMTTLSEKRKLDEKEWITFVNGSVKLTADEAADNVFNEKWQNIENKFIPTISSKIFSLFR